MSQTFSEQSERINPNKAEDNDLTRLDDVGPGSGDITSGTFTTNAPMGGLEDEKANSAMNSGSTSGITTEATEGSEQYVTTLPQQTRATDPEHDSEEE